MVWFKKNKPDLLDQFNANDKSGGGVKLKKKNLSGRGFYRRFFDEEYPMVMIYLFILMAVILLVVLFKGRLYP